MEDHRRQVESAIMVAGEAWNELEILALRVLVCWLDI